MWKKCSQQGKKQTALHNGVYRCSQEGMDQTKVALYSENVRLLIHTL